MTLQKELYEEYRFRSTGSMEMMGAPYTTADYIALMQHFSIDTNFMDWSETLVAPLYFALEAFMEGSPEEESPLETDAALFMMNPYQYNQFHHRKLTRELKLPIGDAHEELGQFIAMLQSKAIIPNLATTENERVFSMYLLGSGGITADIADIKIPESFYYPMNIYSARLNPRVASQIGNFMAYNLYMPADESKGYSYYNLEAIQERALQDDPDMKPFLYKIILKKEGKVEFLGLAKSLGITKAKIYPELDNQKTLLM